MVKKEWFQVLRRNTIHSGVTVFVFVFVFFLYRLCCLGKERNQKKNKRKRKKEYNTEEDMFWLVTPPVPVLAFLIFNLFVHFPISDFIECEPKKT